MKKKKKECRKHRRKCIRNNSSICDRCERLGKLCVQPSQSATSYSENEDNASVDQLREEVEMLEWAIQQMEQQMRSLSCRSNNSDSISAMTRFNDPYNSPLYNDMLKNLMHSWQFQIKNGTFQIETGIRNVSDLLSFQFNTSSIPYLSPLSSASSSSTFSVSSGGSSDINSYDEVEQYRGAESGLLLQFGQESEGYFTFKLLTSYAKRSLPDKVTLSLPCALLLNPAEVIDQIITTYFRCHNTYQTIIHENSFMEKYRNLQDPLTDLITLSICCYTCSTPCLHLAFTPPERRDMADYFYSKAKSIILDQFDDPDKRLENVISINLISKYMHMTLKFKECKRLITIAYQICMDLRDVYEPKENGPTCLAGEMHHPQRPEQQITTKYIKLKTPTQPTKDIDHVLYSRHVTLTMCIRRFMDFISNSIVDDSCFHFPTWLYAEDESETTKRMMQSQNWVLGFFNLPFISAFMVQVHKIHVGKTCTLTFESIVRLEDIINEWSNAMPEEFRLCADLKNEQLCREAIAKTNDVIKLASFVHFHVFMIGIYSCLLQPIALGTENDQLLSYVQQHSLQSSLTSCRLLIHTIHKLSTAKDTSNCHYTLAASDFLYHAIDVLILLSLSPNGHVAKEARAILKECLAEIDCMPYMKDHHVPRNLSPIHLGLIDFNDPTSINLEFYDKYPQPWFAMMYDASHFITSEKQLLAEV